MVKFKQLNKKITETKNIKNLGSNKSKIINTKKRILVTSALPYANGPIHCGHLVEYIQTDIFVRFNRLLGEDAIYICADDTHGAPIEINASKQGITPEQLIAKYYDEHTKDFKDFQIQFDSYYSTNSPENKYYSDLIFERLNKKGLIYKKPVKQTYCNKCKRFLPDRYVRGECPKCHAQNQYGDVCEVCSSAHSTTELINPHCSICKSSAVQKESVHYFFKLSTLSVQLKEWLDNNKQLQPEIVNYIQNWIKEGLNDWDISRDGPYFGFKIPGEEDKYYYVWLDAPIGYIASTQNYCNQHKQYGLTADDYWQRNSGKDNNKEKNNSENKHNRENTEIIHVIGKDIIYFHFLFWPAVLLSAGFNLPNYLIVHGFLTVNGEKMSKSRGTFFTAREFLEKYKAEHLRFYYAATLSRKLVDVDLNFKDLHDKINNELVGNISNFCYRSLSFLEKNFDGRFKELDDSEEGKKLIADVTAKYEKIKTAYLDFNFRDALALILEISALGNRYIQQKEPWKLVKGTAAEKETAQKILGTAANISKDLSILLSPVLPKLCEELQAQLNLGQLTWDYLGFDLKNHKINAAKILASKIESEPEATKPQEVKNISDKKSTKESEKKIQVTYLFPLNPKVAKILEVKNHPNADKLYLLKIDTGIEVIQLVAGIRKDYKPEELVDRKIVYLSNLKPAKIRGEKSQGMILGAEHDGKYTLFDPTGNGQVGDEAFIDGFENNMAEIEYDDFAEVADKLEIKNKRILFNNKPLRTKSCEVKVDVADGAKVR
ncbi:methionine--tRNA ligase [Candidatus Woesearchaeota archaeon]|nr:methionine--tRNA ligase [Candidatus Woesearchaeota archaeon]